MTIQEQITANETLANFQSHTKSYTPSFGEEMYSINGEWFRPKNLKYDSDWNWLIPIYKSLSEHSESGTIQKQLNVAIVGLIECDIQKVFISCYEAISVLNLMKKKRQFITETIEKIPFTGLEIYNEMKNGQKVQLHKDLYLFRSKEGKITINTKKKNQEVISVDVENNNLVFREINLTPLKC